MEMAETTLVLKRRGKIAHVDARRIRFSAHQCFAFDGGADDLRCLRILVDFLASQPGLAVYADGNCRFLRYILEHFPHFQDHIQCVLVERYDLDGMEVNGSLPQATPEEIPSGTQTIFLCATRTFARLRMRRRLPAHYRVLEPDVLVELALEKLPARAWSPWARDIIYPMNVPDIDFQPGMDLIIIDCPARNLGLMPNGLGYVHNALKEVNARYQTCDLDILIYHRFHIRRLCDDGGKITLAGRELPTDPWQAEHYDLWSEDQVIAYFEPEIEEIVDKLVASRPKVLGLSIHGCNEKFSTRVVERVKAALPEIIVLVGGYACYSPDIGLRGFPLADYMCIGEADLTVGPLVERLAKGERPANVPGVMSRFDLPGKPFIPAPMVHDLDLLDHPRYEWYELAVYRNYNGYQLTPVIASRGCRWSRCTFCAERFYWRIRSAEGFVAELEWLVDHGCRLFMFNESDLNGKPEAVLEICDEIMRRGLKVRLTGQLRIHKKCDLAYFKKLRQAGFVALRFGVDAFSENTLRLQKKGYTTATVSQNLRDCWTAGIFSEVNWVIGVPGETDKDIDEGIALILANKPYIGRLANINPLILATGGVYWLEPEKHNIHFRGSREELYHTYPRAIPANLWYSTQPYIDEKVRKQRFEKIVWALHEGKFHVGAWANRIIEDVKHNRDRNRAGPAEAEEGTGQASRGKMNAGIGGMDKPPASGELTFNADARSSSYVFRAGSSLPEEKTHYFRGDLCVISFQGDLFGIEPPALQRAFGKHVNYGERGAFVSRAGKPPLNTPSLGGLTSPARQQLDCGRTVDVRRTFKVSLAKTKAAVPELVTAVDTYNIVSYDSRFYGIPQHFSPQVSHLILERLRTNGSNLLALRRPYPVRLLRRGARMMINLVQKFLPWPKQAPVTSIPWGDVELHDLPGVIQGTNLTQVIDQVERLLGIERNHGTRRQSPDQIHSLPITAVPERRAEEKPHLVGSLEGYNIVEYEGWFYGLPHALGDIRLDEVDVIEAPGVIRDLSREVVEGEIRELSQAAISVTPTGRGEDILLE